MKLRQYSLLVTLLIIGLCIASIAQGPSALVNNQFLNGQLTTGQAKRLIGLNNSGLVSIDPDAQGSTMAGSLTLTGALVNTGGIGASSLTANLKLGYIPLDPWTSRIIAANAIATTTEAGVPDGNTAPLIERVNGATDKQVRLSWVGGNATEIQFPAFALPADFDTSVACTVKFLAAMAGASDTPTITVDWFSGIGDTNQGGATGAVTGTTIAAYSRSIAASAVNTSIKPVSIAVTPGTHATDALRVYAIWVEYTRKS